MAWSSLCEHRPEMPAYRAALLLTLALLAGLLALGLSLQVGWRRSGTRWPHHALYFLVVAGTLASGALAALAGRPAWALLPAAWALLTMPRTRPGAAGHWRRALLCAGLLALGAAMAW